MSCGTPVIVYHTTACTELVGHGCGKVVQKLDRNIYVNHVVQYIRRIDKSTGECCRRFAHETFAADKCMGKYIELLNNLQLAGRK